MPRRNIPPRKLVTPPPIADKLRPDPPATAIPEATFPAKDAKVENWRDFHERHAAIKKAGGELYVHVKNPTGGVDEALVQEVRIDTEKVKVLCLEGTHQAGNSFVLNAEEFRLLPQRG